MNLLSPQYNILSKAGSSLGFQHSLETKAKFSTFRLGKIIDQETRDKISAAMSGENNHMFGKNRPQGAGSPAQKIEVLDCETNETTIYDSMGEAARALNIRVSSISGYFVRDPQKPFRNKYIFKKVFA